MNLFKSTRAERIDKPIHHLPNNLVENFSTR